MRLNGERVTAPSRLVRADDVITVALDRQVRIMKVVGFTERRGGAEAGRVLYADLTPLPPPRDESLKVAAREPGSGRPTKRDRRVIDRLLDEDQ